MTAAGPGKWLLRANHYEWITDYLVSRRMTGVVRAAMASVAGSLALCLLALLNSVDAPRDPIPLVMMWAGFAGGVVAAVLWVLKWPTRRESLAFALVSNTSVALACLSYPNPQGALTGCIAFATIAAYIAFFHGTALVLYNFVLATAVALVVAIRVVASGHVALALVDIFLVLQVNTVMPLAIHVLVRALGVDLEQADRDPLTGLLNRRALQRHIAKLLAATDRRNLVVAVIDLDDFKHINDTYGHQAGDDALVSVGRALGHAVYDTTAVIGRIGGEEFVVAAACATPDPTLVARRICKAIDDLPVPVTASVGTSSAGIESLLNVDEVTLCARFDELVVAADEAMYTAKRAGGNRFRHAS